MSRPRWSSSIWVECPDLWWCGKKHGWKKHKDIPNVNSSNTRKFRTTNRAVRHAIACGPGTKVCRLGRYKKGKGRKYYELVVI